MSDNIVTSDKIKDHVEIFWPGLEFKLLTDRVYISPKMEELEHYTYFQYKPPRFIKNVFECEEFMDDFVNFRRKEIESNNGQEFNWALGKIGGLSFMDYPGKHFRNICFTSDHGIVLVEPQPIGNGRIRKPYPKKDNIVWMRF